MKVKVSCAMSSFVRFHQKSKLRYKMSNIYKEIIEYQRTLFALLNEFFVRATGKSAEKFSSLENFSENIHSAGLSIIKQFKSAIEWADIELRRFYSEEGAKAYSNAIKLAGLKLTLGGSSGFFGTHLQAVNSSLLYADTILIPDPVFPWLEVDRQEERFRHIKMLEAAFFILHMKPIVDAELLIPAICVFPSWEKLLEQEDTETQKGFIQLDVDIFSHYVDESIESFKDIADFIKKYPVRFIEAVESNNLFVGPGSQIGVPIKKAITDYEEYVNEWRSDPWLKSFNKLSAEGKILNAINERLMPQYHLIENSIELNSNPLLPIQQQAHYFKLISEMNSSRLVELGLLDPKIRALITAFSNEKFPWLTKLSIDDIVNLRINNENIPFKKRLRDIVSNLHYTTINDIDKVAREISHDLRIATNDHLKEIEFITNKYQRKHTKTAVTAWASLGAMLIPSLAPLIGIVAPFPLAFKYAFDKLDEKKIKESMAKSLLGVVSRIIE